MITRIGRPSPIDPGTITTLLKIAATIYSFIQQGKFGVDPAVETAISAVETEAGLTDDVMWAWNWFDNRYIDTLGATYWDEDWSDKDYEAALDELRRTGKVEGFDPWWSYKGYAQKHWYSWEMNHYKKLVEGCLGRLGYHLKKEIDKLAESIGYTIQPWYIKYLSYGLMAGLGTALIIVLARRR